MLQLTSIFGPLIRTVAEMMKDLMTFFMIFLIQILAFSCVGLLIFSKLDAYDNLMDVMIMLI